MAENSCDRCNEAVCVQTKQIYDSCKSKECLEDLRVYLTGAGQSLVDCATSVQCKNAEVIWVFTDVEPVPFNKGFYSVELKYFFKLSLDVYSGLQSPRRVSGLAFFEKKIVLFGSEGNAKIFGSKTKIGDSDIGGWRKTNLPEAVVETLDPIALSAKLVNTCEPCCAACPEPALCNVPESVGRVFEDALVMSGDTKRVFVTLGIFTIVKMQRDVQLLIPAYDFCVPDKECVAASEDNPCELFETLNFPVDEFFPPTKCDFEKKQGC